jgi:hypothetical protein
MHGRFRDIVLQQIQFACIMWRTCIFVETRFTIARNNIVFCLFFGSFVTCERLYAP